MAEDFFSTALVTGATSGIGKALCELLVEKKINLIITARSQSQLEALAAEWRSSVSVDVISCDLSIPEERQKVVACIREKTPELVINNAGFGFYGEALSHSTASHLNMLELDCAAVLELSLEAARSLIEAKKEGTILNISSAAGFHAIPYFATYASCKAFVNQFSQALHEELKDQGVNVLTACPGVVDTHFQERAGGKIISKRGVMTVRFAAEEIWRQILEGKAIHIFDWRYRFLTFLSRLMPQKLLFKILKDSMQSRIKT